MGILSHKRLLVPTSIVALLLLVLTMMYKRTHVDPGVFLSMTNTVVTPELSSSVSFRQKRLASVPGLSIQYGVWQWLNFIITFPQLKTSSTKSLSWSWKWAFSLLWWVKQKGNNCSCTLSFLIFFCDISILIYPLSISISYIFKRQAWVLLDSLHLKQSDRHYGGTCTQRKWE